MVTSYDREQFLIRRLWDLHKSPRDHIDGLIGTPRDYSIFEKMLQEGQLRQDFRYQGFPNQSMQSPRQPITAPISDSSADKRRNEENFMKYFGKSSIFDPAHHHNWKPTEAKPRSDGGQGGMQYGTGQIDNSPRARGMNDLLQHKSSSEVRKNRHLQDEANADIKKFREEKQMHNFHREEEQRQGDNRRRKFLENDRSPRDQVTFAREPQKPPTYTKQRGHDLFIDTLGGPGGTVVRQDGYPSLRSMPDPRIGAYPGSPAKGGGNDLIQQEREIRQQREKIENLKKELDFMKSPRGQGGNQDMFQPSSNGYKPSFGMKDNDPHRHDFDEPRKEIKNSLDFDATRGGAGAPRRDDRGKTITRYPVTMQRDDFGSSKIQENIPGKAYKLPNDPVYDPFGRPGGGAPMMDRYGNRNTHTYGNFELNRDASEQTKRVRAKEVMLNDLRVGMEEQKRTKDELIRYEKAPHGDLAQVMRSKEVGNPKRDPITGTLANQHLPNSDVSRIKWKKGTEVETALSDRGGQFLEKKMNYQPVDDVEKQNLHTFLKEQVEEGEKKKYLNKLRNTQEANKHFEQFDQRWGHFGGGAPKDRFVRKKVNLDNALYHYDNRQSRSEESPRLTQQVRYSDLLSGPRQVNPSYQKRYVDEDITHPSPDATPRYVKNTVASTSGNRYEFAEGKSARAVIQRSSPSAPYATQGYAHAY
ncbi:uncharacterized protein [Littorina saxatilis]|uniref:uncharacterized protein isoform X3 n=1 Tax=Littorina saxatilis TaxID=31220 RepID=UPI0038B4A006